MYLSRSSIRLFPAAVARWAFWRKARNPFAGLSFFTRCSDGSLLLAARHWPHQLCWTWRVAWHAGARKKFFYRHNSGGACGLWSFYFSWQNYDSMVALGRYEDDAISFIERDLTGARKAAMTKAEGDDNGC